jgi:hypothetical protein
MKISQELALTLLAVAAVDAWVIPSNVSVLLDSIVPALFLTHAPGRRFIAGSAARRTSQTPAYRRATGRYQ